MILEGRRGKLTSDILRCISYHLSSREDCKDIEYVIDIHPDSKSDSDEITVSPYITVFPGIHNRKQSDRRTIAYHVIYHHFQDIFKDADQSTVHIDRNSLVHGRYRYKKYKLTNRRKWIKL